MEQKHKDRTKKKKSKREQNVFQKPKQLKQKPYWYIKIPGTMFKIIDIKFIQFNQSINDYFLGSELCR